MTFQSNQSECCWAEPHSPEEKNARYRRYRASLAHSDECSLLSHMTKYYVHFTHRQYILSTYKNYIPKLHTIEEIVHCRHIRHTPQWSLPINYSQTMRTNNSYTKKKHHKKYYYTISAYRIQCTLNQICSVVVPVSQFSLHRRRFPCIFAFFDDLACLSQYYIRKQRNAKTFMNYIQRRGWHGIWSHSTWLHLGKSCTT